MIFALKYCVLKMGQVKSTLINYEIINKLSDKKREKNNDQMKLLLMSYKTPKHQFNFHDLMKNIKQEWQITLAQRSNKDDRYIGYRMSDDDFSMKSNLNDNDLDQYLVCNSKIYYELNELKSIILLISLNTQNIQSNIKINCLFKTNYDKINTEINIITSTLTSNPSFPGKGGDEEIELSNDHINIIERSLANIVIHFNIFSETYGLDIDDFNIDDESYINDIVDKMILYYRDIFEKLKKSINNSNNDVSFYILLANMKFYMNVIISAINYRIKKRIERYNNYWSLGWNAFQANLWYYVKKNEIEDIMNSINSHIDICKKITPLQNNLVEIINKIINKKSYKNSDINKIKRSIDITNNNSIYGWMLETAS